MMQEYDDDFFFEEDKINSVDAAAPSLDANVLVPLENTVTVTADPDNKQKNDDNILDFETDCIYNDLRKERYMIQYQDLLGMTVTSGSVTLPKDEKNLIGISIGGGAPLCPCLYIVQIFDNTPASKEGTLQSGDELVGVNGQPCKGKTKVEVAKMIQTAKEQVSINYNKLHADPKQGKTLDIILKKMKHRMVEKMSGGAADALGLSRAILCNDALVAKLSELRHTEEYYSTLLDHAKRMLKSYFDVIQSYKSMGDVFASIGVREPQPRASEAFTKFGQYHRLLERDGIAMLKAVKPILADMGTYLHKAIPDTKLTIKKYADTKFEYLSYCLKVKEMDDEEHGFCPQEPFYRVETGNYEYRLILRCRQDARARFAQLRSDVLVKLELLENKKSQDVAFQLRRFIEGLAVYHKLSNDRTLDRTSDNVTLFPVEVDLSQNAFQYKSTRQIIQDEEDDIEYGKEIKEYHDLKQHSKQKSNRHHDRDRTMQDETEQLLSTEQPFATTEQLHAKSEQLVEMGAQLVAKSEQLVAKTEQLVPGLLDSDNNESIDNLSLLTELGLAEFGEFQDGNKNKNRNNDIDNDEFYEKLLSEICTR